MLVGNVENFHASYFPGIFPKIPPIALFFTSNGAFCPQFRRLPYRNGLKKCIFHVQCVPRKIVGKFPIQIFFGPPLLFQKKNVNSRETLGLQGGKTSVHLPLSKTHFCPTEKSNWIDLLEQSIGAPLATHSPPKCTQLNN